ncbi:chromo domain-containing protein cec-1-like isoform X1 [Argonauta hians]
MTTPSRLPVACSRTRKIGAVLKDRKKRGQIEYLIRWKNFGAEEDSWEPVSNLSSALPLLEEYKKNKSASVQRRRSRSRSRSRTRTKLPVKKDGGTPEKPSRENTPIILSPEEEKSSAPAESEAENVTKEAAEESTAEQNDIVDSPSVVTELSNEGVEQTPVTSFTSTRLATEKTEVYTPVSESVTTVLSRRIKMGAAAKAAEIEEEEKNTEVDVEEEEEEKKEGSVENEIEEEKKSVASIDSDEPVTKEKEENLTKTAANIGYQPEKTWPIVVCIIGLIVVAISFLLGKYLSK